MRTAEEHLEPPSRRARTTRTPTTGRPASHLPCLQPTSNAPDPVVSRPQPRDRRRSATPPRPRRQVLAVALLLIPTISACSAAAKTAATSPAQTSTTVTAAATATETAEATTPAPPPSITVDDNAAQKFGTSTVDDAWSQLATYINRVGFDPTLVATHHPTEADLTPVLTGMSSSCAAAYLDLQTKALAGDTSATGSLQALTTIGIDPPTGTQLSPTTPVLNSAIEQASATVNSSSSLVITATSTAEINLIITPHNHRHAPFTRTTSYTVINTNGHWLLDAWTGSYQYDDGASAPATSP